MPDVSLNLIFDDKRWQQILPEIEDMAQNVKNAVFYRLCLPNPLGQSLFVIADEFQ